MSDTEYETSSHGLNVRQGARADGQHFSLIFHPIFLDS